MLVSVLRLLGGVDDFDATVAGPAIFVGLGADRTLFAIADGRELRIARALQHQCRTDGLRPSFGVTMFSVLLPVALMMGKAVVDIFIEDPNDPVRRLFDLHLEWIEEVERELAPRRRRR